MIDTSEMFYAVADAAAVCGLTVAQLGELDVSLAVPGAVVSGPELLELVHAIRLARVYVGFLGGVV